LETFSESPHLAPPPTCLASMFGGVYAIQHNVAARSWLDLPVLGAHQG
jgi:hypothetical protein